jgi:hypothetical protein
MAIAGDSANIPSRPIKLVEGRVVSYCFTTNKARSIVEQDEERAARRLLAGESFEMHCSGLQIYRVQRIVDELLKEGYGLTALSEGDAATNGTTSARETD